MNPKLKKANSLVHLRLHGLLLARLHLINTDSFDFFCLSVSEGKTSQKPKAKVNYFSHQIGNAALYFLTELQFTEE
jgi:hypothetical protein